MSDDLVVWLRKRFINEREWYGVEFDGLTDAADRIEAQEKLIQEMREAYEHYELALATREHGVVAMGRLVAAIASIYSKSNPNQESGE